MAPSLRQRRYSTDMDDHCLLTFRGVNWRIRAMDGLALIALQRIDRPGEFIALDLSAADINLFACLAAEWLRQDMEIDNAEIVS